MDFFKSMIKRGKLIGRSRNPSGDDSAYNTDYEGHTSSSSDVNSIPQPTSDRPKVRQTRRQRSMLRVASVTSSEEELTITKQTNTISSGPGPTDQPIKIFAQGLCGPRAMQLHVCTEEEKTFKIVFNGSRHGDTTSHLWMDPPDKTGVQIPLNGWIMQVWLKDPSPEDDVEQPPEKSPSEPPVEDSPDKESPQPPAEEHPPADEERLPEQLDPLDERDDTDARVSNIDTTKYPLRLVRRGDNIEVVHKDDDLVKCDPYSSLWAVENHSGDFHTMREPTKTKSSLSEDETDNVKFLTVDKHNHEIVFKETVTTAMSTMAVSQPPVTSNTRYLAVDEETKMPFLVCAGEYFKDLITPQTKIAVTNADILSAST